MLATPQGELAGQVRQALGLGDGPLARFPELLEERFPLDVDFSPLPAMSALGATDPAALDEVLEEMAPGR